MPKRGNELLLGRILVRLGLLTRAQLTEVIKSQAGKTAPLGTLLISNGLIHEADLERALKIQRRTLEREPFTNAAGESTLFGKRVVRLGLATPEQIHLALRIMGQAWEEQRFIRHLGDVLIEQDVLDLAQVLSVLRSQGKVLGACTICASRFNIPSPELRQRTPPCSVCGGSVEALDIEHISDLNIQDDLSETSPHDTLELYSGGGSQSTVSLLRKKGGEGFIDPEVSLGAGVDAQDQKMEAIAKTIGGLISDAKSSDRYVVDREINRGGMGAILAAVDRDIRRQVAMKVMLPKSRINPERVKRFVEEAQVTGQLEHPNIVPIHELGVDGKGHVYFTMKMVHGKSLADVLGDKDQSGKSFDRKELGDLLRIFLKVCDAIAFAHSRGVIHRDLKPENVMVGEFGEVLVMDWGLSRVMGRKEDAAGRGVETLRDEARGSRTLDGMVLGTPDYMPPEQASGELGVVDKRSDIYSLGAVLYEILSGRAPVEGESADEIISKVAEGNICAPEDVAPPERSVPPELSAICMKALAFEKRDRYGNVQALARDLQAYLDGQMVTAYRYNPFEMIGKWMLRHRLAVSAVLLTLTVSLFALGYVRYTQYRRGLEEQAQMEGLKESAKKQREDLGTLDPQRHSLLELQTKYQDCIDGFKEALTHVPSGPENEGVIKEIRSEIGELFFKLFHIAESKSNPELTTLYGNLTKEYLGDKYDSQISGEGTLNLTANTRAAVWLYPTRDPTLQEPLRADSSPYCGFDKNKAVSCGTTPIKNHPIKMGSWLLIARAEGMDELRLPLLVRRNERIALDSARLLKLSEIPEGMVHVPAGTYLLGASSSIGLIFNSNELHPVAHKGFFIGQCEVTHEDWYHFWKHKLEEDSNTVLDYLPSFSSRVKREFYWNDTDVSTNTPKWRQIKTKPVAGITWEAASEYAKWKGMRLPTSVEWEIAARGADGRPYAWGGGDFRRPPPAALTSSRRPADVKSTWFDVSPFGIFDLTGNVSEWTSSWYDEALQVRALRGGNFLSKSSDLLLFLEQGELSSAKREVLGFRLAKDLP